MIDFMPNMKRYIETEIEVLKRLNLEELSRAVNAILEARDRGGTIYTLGNGGSAATASHMVCDLAKGCSEALGEPGFQVECLCDNTPILMAIANDYCYEDVFVRQLRGRLRPEDLVIAISGSGNSENVIRAVSYAGEVGAPVLGITGYGGGRVRQAADYSMHVDIDDMQISEDVHMIFDHMIMRVVEERALQEKNTGEPVGCSVCKEG